LPAHRGAPYIVPMIFRATASGTLTGGGLSVPCALGPAGVIAASAKREGDGASPAGIWPIRRVLYRPDRLEQPKTALPVRPLEQYDGWCDAPDDPRYNQPVKLPYPASAEELWRTDHIYDIIVILGYNDDPVVPGAGSAIFWHLARAHYEHTQGCVAVALTDMLAALEIAAPGDALEIAA
jgi:L,D-peptidoglycan transpeptidase YkuD (ErfK/YbiS/YcfS/YnhG family)